MPKLIKKEFSESNSIEREMEQNNNDSSFVNKIFDKDNIKKNKKEKDKKNNVYNTILNNENNEIINTNLNYNNNNYEINQNKKYEELENKYEVLFQ